MKTKQDIVERIVRELSIHAAIEEMVLYPAIREAAENGDIDKMVLESLEEHHIVKWMLSELERMSPDDERFDAKVTVLIENVRHHVDGRGEGALPQGEQGATGGPSSTDLGEAMART